MEQKIIKWTKVAKHINFTPTYSQKHIINNVNRFNTIVGGKRVGKTKLASFIALMELLESNKTIWIVAPQYSLAKVIWDYIALWTNKYLSDILKLNVQMMEIRNKVTGSVVSLKSADNPVSLKGRGLDLIVGDEVGDWKKGIWEEYIRPNITELRPDGRKGRAFLIGNSNYFGSDWHKLIESLGFDKFSYRLPTAYKGINGTWYSNNPEIVTHEELRDLHRDTDDRIWRQQYLADFVPGQGVVFSNITECVSGTFEEPRSDRFYYIGIDLGRLQDFSVITVIDSKTFHVVYHERFKDIEYTFQKKRMLAVVRKYGTYNTKVIFDQTGVGQPLVDDLQREGINIEGFTLTNMSKKDIIEKLSILMQQKKISYPEITELINELQVFSYKMTETNKVQYGAPSGYHDDCVISLALATKDLQGNPVRTSDPTMTQEDLVRVSSKSEIDGLLSLEEKVQLIKPYSVL